MNKKQKPLGYLGGDIMTHGANLARQEEYDKFIEKNIPVDVYSPVMNKSINDKSNMTVEENNHLAEKICEADIDRLWNSDFVVMCPEQSAIGSMCETGVLYGWKYLTNELLNKAHKEMNEGKNTNEILNNLLNELARLNNKDCYFHYEDIRTNHLPEVDWRRSFSINQMLYGMVLYASNNKGFQSFDEILDELENKYTSDLGAPDSNQVEEKVELTNVDKDKLLDYFKKMIQYYPTINDFLVLPNKAKLSRAEKKELKNLVTKLLKLGD